MDDARVVRPYKLFYIIDLYYDDTDVLIVGVVVDFGDVPVFGEEEEEFVGCGVIEFSL